MYTIFIYICLLCISSFAHAANVSIDTNSAPYSLDNRSQGIGVISEVIERQGGLFAMVAIYNTTVNPTTPIKNGDIITIKWQDGSSEKATVVDLRSSVGIVPIVGTQSQPAGGGIGYTTDGFGGSFGGIGVTGFTPIYTTVQICIGSDCWQTTVISGYSYTYGNIGPKDRVV